MRDIIKATFLIIGTIIGAGFASGQELYQFFLKFGKLGFFSMIISCVISGIIMLKTMKFVKNENVNGYNEFLKKLFVR